jgi:glutathione S-transferase
LAESDAILVYFAEGTEYLPTDPYERAQALQWMFFEQYSHEPNIAVLRFWAHAGIEPEAREVPAKREGGYRALEAMERHLAGRDYFVGAGPTVADLAPVVWLLRPGETRDPRKPSGKAVSKATQPSF